MVANLNDYRGLAEKVQIPPIHPKVHDSDENLGRGHLFNNHLLDIFNNDTDSIYDFLECCDDNERSIIDSAKDPKAILQIVMRIKDDVEETSKDLAMDD